MIDIASPERAFPVVCVGGSAGGLDAYTRLLTRLPPDMGVAIVIVNHVRTFATQLHEILPRFTTMPVELITERLVIEPKHVFIIPEQRDLHVEDGQFRLKPVSKPRGWPDVITVFLPSLTEHWDGRLVAVIVSGFDGDGAAALCGIREAGGITIARLADTAIQPDMPESAIESGCGDGGDGVRPSIFCFRPRTTECRRADNLRRVAWRSAGRPRPSSQGEARSSHPRIPRPRQTFLALSSKSPPRVFSQFVSHHLRARSVTQVPGLSVTDVLGLCRRSTRLRKRPQDANVEIRHRGARQAA